jgi:hypothetical protein
MVSIPTGLAINTPVAGDRTTASGFRKVLGALFKQSAPGVPLAGILPAQSGATPLLVTSDPSTMVYHVSAGFALTTRTSQGAYLVGTLTDVNVPTIPADAVYGRYDVLYIFQPDPELADTGVARIDVVNGAATNSPVEPAVPTGALKLGRKLVPAGASNTSVGTAIDGLAGMTGLNVDWSNIVNKPSTFPPAAHSGALVTSGIIPAGVTLAGDLTGTIDGKNFTVSQTQPTGANVGDLWIGW